MRILFLFLICFPFYSTAQTNTFPSSGNVGIGTIAPTQKLTIDVGSSNGGIQLESTSGQNIIRFRHTNAGSNVKTMQQGIYNGKGFVSAVNDVMNAETHRFFTFNLSNGNVGIGTENPQTKLHVEGESYFKTDYDAVMTFDNTDNSWQYLQFMGNGTRKVWMGIDPRHNFNIAMENSGSILLNGGNVGIGTGTPQAKLHVEGNQLLLGDLRMGEKHDAMGYGKAINFGASGNWDPIWLARYNNAADRSELRLNVGDDGVDNFTIGHHFHSNGEWRPAVSISSGGQMSIGTTEMPSGFRLAVGGNIIAEKIKVKLQPWADYVFEPTYKLPTLQDVETFIKQHKHLPDVPSAKEVEEKGIDLGDNQAVLLKKIEELTLYVIEQNKQLQKQQQTILEQTERLEKLERKSR